MTNVSGGTLLGGGMVIGVTGGDASRAELAAVMTRFEKLLKKQKTGKEPPPSWFP